MSNLVKELDEQIDIDKEVIEVLPKTGIKQIREFKKRLEEMQARYDFINNSALEEMNKRYDRINSIETNPEIAEVSKSIYELDNLVLSEKGESSFERMQLDKLTYKINGYYKKNLEVINQDIMACINKFEEVGVHVTEKDFQISEYANEYMKVLLEEAENGDINSERVKDTFEKVYWKSSDLIVHILVNIRCIYDANENTIDKYYKNKTEQIFKSLQVNEKEVQSKKEELSRKLNALKSVDGRIILDSFLDGLYSIGDYRTDTYTNIYENLVSKKLGDLSPEEKKSMDDNFKKLNNNLYEYTTYLEFKFIIDEVFALKDARTKEHADVKENKEKAAKDKKSKNQPKILTSFEQTKSEIKRVHDEIKKLNSEIENGQAKKKGFLFFFKKKALPKSKSELILERDNKVLELKALYFEFDNCGLKDKIFENIRETSKIYDVLKIASYDYGFLARTIIKKHTDIVEEDIDKMIERFIKFVRLYPFSVLNNVKLDEKKDIAVVIKDKHKLLGLEISKENFMEANFDEFAKQTQIIDYYNDIQRSNIPLEDIQFVMNSRATLKK